MRVYRGKCNERIFNPSNRDGQRDSKELGEGIFNVQFNFDPVYSRSFRFSAKWRARHDFGIHLGARATVISVRVNIAGRTRYFIAFSTGHKSTPVFSHPLSRRGTYVVDERTGIR